jgi:hypothetical protein
MSKSPRQDSGFRAPPIWIHVSEAFFSPREAKKRAVIRLIDSLKTGVRPRPGKPGPDPKI